MRLCPGHDDMASMVRSEFQSVGRRTQNIKSFYAEITGQKCASEILGVLENTMSRLPPQIAPLVYGIIQSAITTGVAFAIAVAQLTGFGIRFLMEWLSAWSLAFLIMLPVVGFVSPLIQRCVVVLTKSTVDDRSIRHQQSGKRC